MEKGNERRNKNMGGRNEGMDGGKRGRDVVGKNRKGKRKGTMGSRKGNAMSMGERIRIKRTKMGEEKKEMQCGNTEMK